MKTAAIIEARMTSTRLPGKVMCPILGKPMLELLIERLKHADTLDEIIIATTTNKEDNIIEELSETLHVGCYRGSEDDVLDRVLHAAVTSNIDLIIEITGDCPLIDPGVIDTLVQIYLSGQYDFVSNTLKQTYPNGLDTRIFSTETLKKVASLTDDPVDHEHVSLYIYEHPEIFSLYNHESDLLEKYWDLRLTVDTIEDFALISTIYEKLYITNPNFRLPDIITLLEKEPELVRINQHIHQKPVH